ncbi:MAG: hypothetical protein KJZ93_21960, partial [Caldilineaceae bacterium]|nr:hypothetical protein [Caldilineaceae bacterium]
MPSPDVPGEDCSCGLKDVAIGVPVSLADGVDVSADKYCAVASTVAVIVAVGARLVNVGVRVAVGCAVGVREGVAVRVDVGSGVAVSVGVAVAVGSGVS